ncbi:hypothetical protein [Sphingomonas sp. PR090111-T3T-6A]|uniref:hypothetical protein n=1 Tax=Sphingomonas sp. PR090111-T3T-6A TaxID=685778 RepID=UPI0003724234|nr:hypothetical protein [Sphingomonas sp. PR090111-T3T-6A]
MRNLVSKFAAGSMVIAASLFVAACGHSENAANTADTNMTDMNTIDSATGTTNDMSATDATATDANMAMDNSAMAAVAGSNEAAPANQM